MKILQINKLYSPWVGGIEKVVQDISEKLKDHEEVEVLVCQPKGKTKVNFVNGVKVTYAGSIGIFNSMPVSLSFPFLFKRMSKNNDILHFHLPFPLAVLSALIFKPKAKIVVWWHSDIVKQKFLLMFYKPFLKKFLRMADKIIVATQYHIESSSFLKDYREKCCVIPFGIEYQKYSKNNLDKIQVLKLKKQDKPAILFVGRLVYYKGISYLIEALRDVNANLYLVGSGPLKDELIKLTEQVGIENRVFFLDNVSDEDLLAYYQACDLLVLPSVENSEAFGLVQLEAMACGKPVINTWLPTGVPTVSLHEKTGYTVNPADSLDIAQAVNKILSDKKLYDQFSKNALERVKEIFSIDKMIDDLLDIYEKEMAKGA